MGLSNEERMQKFLWCMLGWRKKVVSLREALPRNEERAKRVVASWIHRIDGMTGEVIRRINRSSDYWLLGENNDSFRGLMADAEQIRVDAEPHSFIQVDESKDETAGWWSEKVDFAFVADRLMYHPYKGHEGVVPLARWWNQHAYVSAVVYAVWRYNDSLFSKSTKREFQALIGEMANLRFEVCFSKYGDPGDTRKLEVYLLLKAEAFHILLRNETAKLHGAAYTEKKVDGYALFEKIAAMSALDLKNLLEAEDARKRKVGEAVSAPKDKPEKTSGLFGPKVMSDAAPVAAAGAKKRKH